MKIVVCVKAVPRSVSKVQISDAGDRIDAQSDMLVINESDEYALEEALFLKKQFSGEVVAVTVGRLPAQRVLQLSLAKGASRAIRVDAQFGDAERTSAALAAAIRKIGFDLVLTGVESSDNLGGEVGTRLAARLGVPYAFAVVEAAPGSSPDSIKVTKEVGGGKKQVLEFRLPALLCVQQGILPLTYVPVRNLLQAQSKPVERFSLEELGFVEKGNKLKMVDVFRPSDTHHAEMIDGKTPEKAQKLLEIIKRF